MDDTERAFSALADNAPDAIARLTRRGRFLYVNRVIVEAFDREAGDLVGRSVSALGLPAPVALRYLEGVRETFRAGREVSFDFSLEVRGTTRHFTVRIVPEFAAHGAIDSALAVTYDVTRRTEVELQRDAMFEREQSARARAEAASRARDQFLSIVSHELRSPLNGIQSWSHVLENQLNGSGEPNPVAMRALEGIRAGIEQQVRLIGHLLDATVAITGELRLDRESSSVREAIEAAVAEVRATAIAKDVALQVDMRLDDERMDADPSRLRQIFAHLLTNAVKFTPRGGSIWLSARVDGGRAIVIVRDSGRGLPPGWQDWLFVPFRQADSSNTRRTGGIGLGLALARRLAELHGGGVEAESAGPHLGATFTVTLPLEPVWPGPGDPTAHTTRATLATAFTATAELAGVNALVIDDQLEAREALSTLLEQFGAHVSVAASSGAGFAWIESGDPVPDIVICDIAMPEEDGYAFVRRLRAREADPTIDAPDHTPVIALSAFAESDHRRQGAEAGFDSYLAKPVNPQLLLSTLARFARGTAT